MRRDGAYAAPGKSAVTASSSTRVRARSTLGMMLDGSTISNLCVGGPAFNCQRLEKHDVIVGAHPPGNRVHSERSDLLCVGKGHYLGRSDEDSIFVSTSAGVDGAEVDPHNIVEHIVGSDVPNSSVALKVLKNGTQHIEEVHLVRMSTEEILDRRRLFEHFTELKDIAVQEEDQFQVERIEDAIELWTQMMIDDAEHQRECSDRIHELETRFGQGLDDLLELLFRIQSSSTPESSDDRARVQNSEVDAAEKGVGDRAARELAALASATAVALEGSMADCENLAQTMAKCCNEAQEFWLYSKTMEDELAREKVQHEECMRELEAERVRIQSLQDQREDEKRKSDQCTQDLNTQCKTMEDELAREKVQHEECMRELEAERVRIQALQDQREDEKRQSDQCTQDLNAQNRALASEVDAYDACVHSLEASLLHCLENMPQKLAAQKAQAQREMTRVEKMLQREVDAARAELYRAQEGAIRDVKEANGLDLICASTRACTLFYDLLCESRSTKPLQVIHALTMCL